MYLINLYATIILVAVLINVAILHLPAYDVITFSAMFLIGVIVEYTRPKN